MTQGYKQGANINDVNRLREYYVAGKSAEEAARALLIELDCVKNFFDYFGESAVKKVEKLNKVGAPGTARRGRPPTKKPDIKTALNTE